MRANWRRRLETMLGVPATEGNQVDILRNGEEIFPAMLEAIRGSERSIDLLTFIYWTGDIAHEFAHALAERAADGVRVRALLDAFGARKLDESLIKHMLDSGVDVRWFRPVDGDMDLKDVQNRTHRKVMVCDERIGFTGGVGIAQEWCGDARDETEWRDTHVRIEGPAVDGLRGAFVDNWFETSDDLFDEDFDICEAIEPVGDHVVQVIRGSAGAGNSAIATMQALLIEGASEHLRIAAAYFTPAQRIIDAIHNALERGVEVDILVPGPHADKGFMRLASHAVFEELLEAGARVSTFTPSMLHCKVVVVDGEIATTGSANFDDRAVQHDDEVNAVFFDEEVASILAAHFDDDLERSEQIDLDEWQERGMFRKAAESVVDSVAGLL